MEWSGLGPWLLPLPTRWSPSVPYGGNELSECFSTYSTHCESKKWHKAQTGILIRVWQHIMLQYRSVWLSFHTSAAPTPRPWLPRMTFNSLQRWKLCACLHTSHVGGERVFPDRGDNGASERSALQFTAEVKIHHRAGCWVSRCAAFWSAEDRTANFLPASTN